MMVGRWWIREGDICFMESSGNWEWKEMMGGDRNLRIHRVFCKLYMDKQML
jgi:hypothetical protein